MDEATLKKRMVFTLAVTIACAILAMASIVGAVFGGIAWLNYAFWVFLAGGFAVQIWMIYRFWQAGKKS